MYAVKKVIRKDIVTEKPLINVELCLSVTEPICVEVCLSVTEPKKCLGVNRSFSFNSCESDNEGLSCFVWILFALKQIYENIYVQDVGLCKCSCTVQYVYCFLQIFDHWCKHKVMWVVCSCAAVLRRLA